VSQPDLPNLGRAGQVSHAHLVKMAERWLRARCPVVITEMSSGGGAEPDALGWRTRGSILIECKASRSDLRADAEKPHRRRADQLGPGERGCGMGNLRYLLAPPEVVRGFEDPLVPKGWGVLIASSERSVRTLVTPEEHQCDWDAERILLISCLRRLGIESLQGTSVRVYKFQTRCRATVSLNTEAT
jgi:hypothetical protein